MLAHVKKNRVTILPFPSRFNAAIYAIGLIKPPPADLPFPYRFRLR